MIPDYVICLECESPCYIFEWKEGRLIEVLCTICGNEDPAHFVSESEYEEMSMDPRFSSDS
jgi:translation initiation factor 2 beta subunit (eIF-2beta)/eIF-5